MRYFTGTGVSCGLVAGLIAVTVTYVTELGGYFGIGRYPLTIHSAGWGIFFNLLITVIVSSITQETVKGSADHRSKYHNFISEYTKLPQKNQRWKIPTIILTIVWFLCAIGPFAVLGNESNPNEWIWGIPTIWLWQIVWWIIGCVMMYLLAFKLQMSTVPAREVEPINQEY